MYPPVLVPEQPLQPFTITINSSETPHWITIEYQISDITVLALFRQAERDIVVHAKSQ
jgi:hypothetical protein